VPAYSNSDQKVVTMTAALTDASDGAKVFEGPKTLLPQSCQLVIFGGPGDLSWRKLLPAVYNLDIDGVLPSHFTVVAFGGSAQHRRQFGIAA
jgi:glucose-6-phosphate 1-dehydrogenase